MAQSLVFSIQSPVANEEVGQTTAVSGTWAITGTGWPRVTLEGIRVQVGAGTAFIEAQVASGSFSCSGHLPPGVQGGQTVAITAIAYGYTLPRTPLPHLLPGDPNPDPDPEPDPEPEPEPEPEPFEQTVTVNVRVRPPFVPGPVDRVFETTSYLDELLSLANRYVSVGGAQPGPSPAVLAGRLSQPLDRLTRPELYEAATTTVPQARIAVEVLRRALGTTPAPSTVDQKHRATAYEALLLALGTAYPELRGARIAAPEVRAALADRLGLELGDSRPDQLDTITIAPDQITDAQLETLFGYRSTNVADVLLPPSSIPTVLLSRQAALRSRWRRADETLRDGSDGPLPIVDPDVITEAYLKAGAQDPARVLWTQRTAWLTAGLTDINGKITTYGRTLDGLDALVKDVVGDIDLVGLDARDRDGADISADLAEFALAADAFRYLVGLRAALAAGALLDSEWRDVAAILLRVRKQRKAADWRADERTAGVILQPATFQLPVSTPDAPPLWRAEPETRADWRATLEARTHQASTVDSQFAAAVESAERRALPDLRDALVAELGVRHTPAETADQAADRLSRELCVDLRAAAGLAADRVEQAIDSMQNLLVAVRSGRFATAGGAPTLTIADEVGFDVEWDWLVSYQRWRSAMRAFAYPENQVQPSLYRTEFVTAELQLAPTQAYRAFLAGLAGARRLTPQEARDRAAAYVTAVRTEIPGVPTIVLTDLRTTASLVAHRNQCTTLSGAATKESQIPQYVRELFWLVPMALARKLQDSGEYATALDWYQTVFSYQGPQAQRTIYRGLVLEANTVSDYNRFPGWLAQVKELNPHFTARKRRNAYTRFTVMSIVECLLAFADSEFARNAAAANARARALYQSAVDVLGLPEGVADTGSGVPFPANPVWQSLRAEADAGLAKIHAGLNIGGFADPAAIAADSFLPSPYRFGTVVERAKNLVSIAQQIESAYFSALERLDVENYGLLQAGHDLRVAEASLSIQDLKVSQAGLGVRLATLQRDKSDALASALGKRLSSGLNTWERQQLNGLRAARRLQEQADVSSMFGGFFSAALDIATGKPFSPFGLVSQYLSGQAGLASQDARLAEVRAGYERRAEDWRLQQNQAARDVEIGNQQILLARSQQALAVRERDLAGLQQDHALAVAEFLATKFTNAELHEWMSRVLGRVYAYFLQQATALALLAQAQLAFERQEPAVGFIAADYWQESTANPEETNPDRRGLTGSARLLEDIYRLDQYAFQTNRRKLHLTQTLALSRIAGHELQELRQTGVVTFSTPTELFDREFPGHYLRLVNKVTVTVIAATPTSGIRATLTASGVSRTVVARGPFDTVTLRREPESIAFTSPVNASGQFELEPDNGMLLPFEGMGVDAVWRLELPKAANPFDYTTIADVLFTVEYTALDSPEHRQNVLRAVDRTFSGDQVLSVRNQFPDAWYELANPGEDPMRVLLTLTSDDFPPHVTDLRVGELTLFALRADGLTDELTVTSLTHAGVVGGEVATTGGVVSTRRPGGSAWQPLLGGSPVGDWELRLPDNEVVRSWFADGQIEDLVLVLTLAGTTPSWP